MMPKPIPNIGNVAKRALETIDITILEDLTSINEKSLSKLHGVGPKAIKSLKKPWRLINYPSVIQLIILTTHPFQFWAI